MGRRADGGKRVEWVDRFRQYEKSELTVAEFCDWAGVSVATFYNWRRKMADGLQALEPQTHMPSLPSIGKSVFLPVRVFSQSDPASPIPPIEIQLSNGVRILVPLGEAATLSHTLSDVLIAAAGLPSAMEDEAC